MVHLKTILALTCLLISVPTISDAIEIQEQAYETNYGHLACPIRLSSDRAKGRKIHRANAVNSATGGGHYSRFWGKLEW